MKYISSRDINYGVALVILFGITLTGGAFKRPLFIIAGLLLISYFMLDKKRLRCPNCGGFENLERLMYAKTHVYHCRHCGEKINIL